MLNGLLACFFFLFCFGGIAIALLQPPFQAPDEPIHWQTAWYRYDQFVEPKKQTCDAALNLPEGFAVSAVAFHPDRSIPSGAVKNLNSINSICMPKDVQPVPYGNILTYPAVILARLLVEGEAGSPEKALLVFYLSRLINFSVVFLAFFRYLKHANDTFSERNKWHFGTLSIATICVTPIFLQQSMAVSADALLNCFVILLTALIFFNSQFKVIDSLLLLISGIATAVSKPTVFPLIFASIIVLAIQYFPFDFRLQISSTSLKRLLQNLALRSTNGSHLVIFFLATLTLFIGLNADRTISQANANNANPALQVNFLLGNPAEALKIMTEGLFRHLSFPSFLGELGWVDTRLLDDTKILYAWLFHGALIIDASFFIVTLKNNRKTTLNRFMTAFISALTLLCGALGSTFLITLALYLTYSPVAWPIAYGLQPRYYLHSYIFCLLSVGIFLTLALRQTTPKNDSQKLTTDKTEIRSQLLGYLFWLFIGIICLRLVASIILTIVNRYW